MSYFFSRSTRESGHAVTNGVMITVLLGFFAAKYAAPEHQQGYASASFALITGLMILAPLYHPRKVRQEAQQQWYYAQGQLRSRIVP